MADDLQLNIASVPTTTDSSSSSHRGQHKKRKRQSSVRIGIDPHTTLDHIARDGYFLLARGGRVARVSRFGRVSSPSGRVLSESLRTLWQFACTHVHKKSANWTLARPP
jgi:hypothetical protein